MTAEGCVNVGSSLILRLLDSHVLKNIRLSAEWEGDLIFEKFVVISQGREKGRPEGGTISRTGRGARDAGNGIHIPTREIIQGVN